MKGTKRGLGRLSLGPPVLITRLEATHQTTGPKLEQIQFLTHEAFL